jgi:transposase
MTAMNVRYIVELTDAEREHLVEFTRKGKPGARKVRRAQILLMADRRAHTDAQISKALCTGTSTVYRTKQRFVECGVEHALSEASRPGGERLLDAKQEATLVALACTKPPEGRAKWTMQLLADRLVVLTDVESVSAETVRRRLRENELKPWQKRMWCIPQFDADYVANMEDVLDLYEQPRDVKKPLVCFDETFKQLVQEVRPPIPAFPGETERYDSEYKRNGTANLFMFVAPLEGWRHVKVTDRKANADFAECMRDLVDIHYAEADVIRVVLDNLSTHRPGALYQTFPPEEARRILRKLEFHYTPKHGSWLNMAEIEIGILDRQCLDRRIGDRVTLENEVAAWEVDRNAAGATIEWMFDLDRARSKLTRAYTAAKDRSTEETAATSAAVEEAA